MRLVILACVTLVVLVALAEAMSLNSGKILRKSSLVSKIAARKQGEGKSGEKGDKKDDKDDDDNEEGPRDIPTATLDALLYGVQCMVDEALWDTIPGYAWEADDWDQFAGEEWYRNPRMQAAFHAIYYVNMPEHRPVLDDIFRTYVEAVNCELMGELGAALELFYADEGPNGEAVFSQEYEFIGIANELMSDHCHGRIQERNEFEAMLQEAEGRDPTATKRRAVEGMKNKRNLEQKLRSLLATKLHLRAGKLRGTDDGYEMSTAGFQAVAFAGMCLDTEATVAPGEEPEWFEHCESAIEGVAEYVTAIHAKDQETVEFYEHIFKNYNQKYKCDELEMARAEIGHGIQAEGTFVQGVLLYNYEFVIHFQGMVCEHCAIRNMRLATMWHEWTEDDKRTLDDILKKKK